MHILGTTSFQVLCPDNSNKVLLKSKEKNECCYSLWSTLTLTLWKSLRNPWQRKPCTKFVLATWTKWKFGSNLAADNSFAGDKDAWLSMIGYTMLFFMTFPIAWKSKLQRSIELSSLEAQIYHTIADYTGNQALLSSGILIEFSIIMVVDNFGAISWEKSVHQWMDQAYYYQVVLCKYNYHHRILENGVYENDQK